MVIVLCILELMIIKYQRIADTVYMTGHGTGGMDDARECYQDCLKLGRKKGLRSIVSNCIMIIYDDEFEMFF